MSKEKQCKCCQNYWYTSNLTNGLCPNCYDYVADLEAKLAESEEDLKQYKYAYENAMVLDYTTRKWRKIGDIQQENERLKQQLAEKEEELHSAKVGEEFALKCCDEASKLLALQVTGHNQDKISFCVEQLEKVKEYIDNHKCKAVNDDRYVVYRKSLVVQIDNQIKQLKEEK